MPNDLRRLVHAALASGVLLTVLPNRVYHLRWFKVVNDTALPVTFKLGIDGTGAGQEFTNTITVAPGSSYREFLAPLSMIATETLQALVTGAGATIIVSVIDQS